MLLGVHCSVAGGLQNAFKEAAQLGIDTFQIFTRNQRQWKAKPVSQDEQQQFLEAGKHSEVKIVFSHCSYLLNLASPDAGSHAKATAALTEEVIRCTRLGLLFCVLHPGAAGSQTQDEAIAQIAKGLRKVLKTTKDSTVKIALENTAGQGTSAGGSFEHLKMIADLVDDSRIGFCLDTCHAFAAGYDIRTESGINNTLSEFDSTCGLSRLCAFHLNDSKGDLGSRLDRHAHIGQGKIGLIPFRYIMRNFQHIPKVIETPKEDDWDFKNLQLLRKLSK